ncbi:hypothetical protein NM688_g8879 [Phlebia brevispora]|uniref:Uncharacterized protein n=1 Tax=Phlebia brevispora TaxID=194682 RepID=A0ACC1RLX4_9APHY|nr:hypothetical protein NM688_g8879 [Phlebia brevispora]
MSTSPDCSAYFTQNTDISGIGVRVAFYLQIFLLFILQAISPEEASNAFWTLTSMAFGLAIAAVASAAQNMLSFYNALTVLNLVWMANSCLVMVYTSNGVILRKNKMQNSLLNVVFPVEIFLSQAPMVYLWATAYHFGPDAQCTPYIKIYFVFWRVAFSFKAIRIIALIFYSFMTLSIMMYAVKARSVFDSVYEPYVELDPESCRAKHYKKRKLTPILLGLPISSLLTIPPIELFLKQYPQQDNVDSQWSFGQILALIAVLPSMMSVSLGLVQLFLTAPADEKDELPEDFLVNAAVEKSVQVGEDVMVQESGPKDPIVEDETPLSAPRGAEAVSTQSAAIDATGTAVVGSKETGGQLAETGGEVQLGEDAVVQESGPEDPIVEDQTEASVPAGAEIMYTQNAAMHDAGTAGTESVETDGLLTEAEGEVQLGDLQDSDSRRSDTSSHI